MKRNNNESSSSLSVCDDFLFFPNLDGVSSTPRVLDHNGVCVILLSSVVSSLIKESRSIKSLGIGGGKEQGLPKA